MNYEQEYKDALERAKKFDEKYGGGYATYIFPELQESEDERIRKELIETVKCIADGDAVFLSEQQEQRYLAYLEKQKEQKPNYCHYGGDPSIERCRICSASCSVRITDKQKPAEWNQDEFTENIRRLITDKLTVTTKSTDGSTLSSTVFIDDKTAKDIANGILFYVGKEVQKNPDRDVPSWSEEDKYAEGYMDGWKNRGITIPAWSKEDEERLRSILFSIGYCKEEYPDKKEYSKDISWLKSLKPQPKPEWSKEDEDRIRQIERIAQQAGCTQKLQEEIHDWLKSLRPQPQKELSIEKAIKWLDDTFYFLDNSSGRGRDCEITTHDFDSLEEMYNSFRKAVTVDSKPHWKPSEEQMGALLAVFNDPNNIGSQTCQLALTGLYEDLKKLKEE